jgi:hypothetical protein
MRIISDEPLSTLRSEEKQRQRERERERERETEREGVDLLFFPFVSLGP